MGVPPQGNFLPGPHLEVRAVHGDLSQEIVQITTDRLTLVLYRHIRAVECGRYWITPAGILLALILTFVTTSFRDALFLSAATWKAIFIIVTVIITAWLLATLRHLRKKQSIDDLVEHIKKNHPHDAG